MFPRNLSTQFYYIRDKMLFKLEEIENAAFSFACGQNKNILKTELFGKRIRVHFLLAIRNRKHAIRLHIEKVSGCLSEREML